jgi:hypothetical protein
MTDPTSSLAIRSRVGLRLLIRALPFVPITFYASIVASQLHDVDWHLNYVGGEDLVDSGVGYFPLLWIMGAIPFILTILMQPYGRPARMYWAAVFSGFITLSAAGFFLDHVMWYQLCIGCS